MIQSQLMKALPLQSHPFRLLLNLEWLLLSLSAFKLLGFPGWGRLGIWSSAGWFSTIAVEPGKVFWLMVLLTVFSIMGLRLPTERWAKCLYIAILFMLLGAIVGVEELGLDSVSPLLIVVLLRSSVMFQRPGRWTIAGLMWLTYPVIFAPIALIFWIMLQFSTIQDFKAYAIPGMVILPNNGVQFNLSFTPEQVQQFSKLLQNFILYSLADSSLSFGLILIFVLLLVNSLVNERQGRRKLVQAHEQLYQYSLQIEDQATLQERTRIAREIHDSLGHLLTAQSVVLENTALLLKTDLQEAKAFLEDSKRLGAEARRELRQAVLMLRSDPLKGKPFEDAIVDLIAEFSQVTDMAPTLEMKTPMQLPQRYQVAVYRILEEALTNIQKHSEATEVSIKLQIQPETNQLATPILCVQIADNGKGFDPQQNQTGFGLQGMQERTESLGGQIQFTPQAGCCITASFPLLGAIV